MFEANNIIVKEKSNNKKLHKDFKNKQHKFKTNIISSIPNCNRCKFY